ncbi:hypothetical protein QA649_09660 [Bradyrhizobium sp. CB1717]|nr:hypothetical protein [Bradyrhizobium sp. CB1717]WFU26451.1 hypothetical protein QA649_09660 [Bradyrhizobium sp. CB1717]
MTDVVKMTEAGLKIMEAEEPSIDDKIAEKIRLLSYRPRYQSAR